jgi:adenylate cyclase class IV
MRLSDKIPSRKMHRAQASPKRKISPKPSPKAGNETEVKLRVRDRQALLRQLARLRATYYGRVHEMNTLYDTPDGALKRAGRLLRIRVEHPADGAAERAEGGTLKSARMSNPSWVDHGALLTFKGPARREEPGKSRGAGRYKIREEREICVEDEAALARILGALGLRPSFRYEKYRSTYRLPRLSGVTLELDETPIGDFLEAEGSREAIDRSAALLGYQPAEYITKSYGQLFLDSKRGRTASAGPRDMLFGSKK